MEQKLCINYNFWYGKMFEVCTMYVWNSTVFRWTYLCPFDAQKIKLESVRCSKKWCSTHHYEIALFETCILTNNLLKDPRIKECFGPLQILRKLYVNNCDQVRWKDDSKRNEENVGMTIIVQTEHLHKVWHNIGVVQSTNSYGNPDEQNNGLQIPKGTLN